jgi:hypothetical protein
MREKAVPGTPRNTCVLAAAASMHEHLESLEG